MIQNKLLSFVRSASLARHGRKGGFATDGTAVPIPPLGERPAPTWTATSRRRRVTARSRVEPRSDGEREIVAVVAVVTVGNARIPTSSPAHAARPARVVQVLWAACCPQPGRPGSVRSPATRGTYSGDRGGSTPYVPVSGTYSADSRRSTPYVPVSGTYSEDRPRSRRYVPSLGRSRPSDCARRIAESPRCACRLAAYEHATWRVHASCTTRGTGCPAALARSRYGLPPRRTTRNRSRAAAACWPCGSSCK